MPLDAPVALCCCSMILLLDDSAARCRCWWMLLLLDAVAAGCCCWSVLLPLLNACAIRCFRCSMLLDASAVRCCWMLPLFNASCWMHSAAAVDIYPILGKWIWEKMFICIVRKFVRHVFMVHPVIRTFPKKQLKNIFWHIFMVQILWRVLVFRTF